MHRMMWTLSRQLQLIPRDIQRAVKNTEDIDVPVVLHKIGDAVMPVEQNPHMARGSEIAITNFGKDRQVLRPFIYSSDSTTGCTRNCWRRGIRICLQASAGLLPSTLFLP